MSKAMFSTAAALHIFRMMTVTTGLAGLAGLAHAGTVHASYAETGAPTSIPYGWIDFCGRHPEECHNSPLPAMNIRLTSAVLHKLNQINSKVNAFIQPVSNMDQR